VGTKLGSFHTRHIQICDTNLVIPRYFLIIDYCPQCKGVWSDKGEMDIIAHVQNIYEDAHYRNIVMGELLITITTIKVEEKEPFLKIYLILVD
jgi:hypothetical protein